jgi:acyl dehydratase
MDATQSFDGTAHNQATESENQIHSDAVAKQYGFRGGLVPGVTVYAYLVEPAVRAWGLEWLRRGKASVTLRKPLYAGSSYHVEVAADGDSAYRATLTDGDGTLCAESAVALGSAKGDRPARRGDPPTPEAGNRPDATRAVLETSKEKGLGSLHILWDGTGTNDRYQPTLDAMPDLVRPDRDGFAHPAFTLSLANWVLSTNVRLGPWIHVESEVRHLDAVPLGTPLIVEASVRELFERRGHEFVDLDVAVYGADDRPVLTAFHRAIYQLRG